MPTFFPLEAPLQFDCVRSDLLRFDWQESAADFVIPDDDERVLRIKFHSGVIVRMLDEMPLSIESDPTKCQGLVPHHFAYRVEGAPFGKNQPEDWQEVLGPRSHYQFVTGGGCLDVLTSGEPEFAIVPATR